MEGELYFEYHRGTYTSMARNKRSNRKIELHMMDLELLSLLAQAKVAYPEAEIDKLWHGILINQSMIFCPVPPSTKYTKSPKKNMPRWKPKSRHCARSA